MPEIEVKTVVKAQAKTLKISAKVRDEGYYQLLDENQSVIHEDEGYVPDFMPGEHYGDYLDLEIDLETGRVVNWQPPTAQALQEWMERG